MSDNSLLLDFIYQSGAFALSASVEIELAGITAIYGPNGAGKSTLLKLIAGLQRPSKGSIELAGEKLYSKTPARWTPPHKRGIGLVFQDLRLIPHLSVLHNLTFAAHASKTQRAKIDEIAADYDLTHLLAHKPAMLSGGERQRAAIAQAMLASPRLLLLDEPLSSLDEKSRHIISTQLLQAARSGLPMLFVSHSATNICILAERAMTLSDGRLGKPGPVSDILNAHGFLPEVKSGYKTGLVLEGKVSAIKPELELIDITVPGYVLSLPYASEPLIGDHRRILIRAEDIILSRQVPECISVQNCLEGRVKALSRREATGLCDVEIRLKNGQILPACVTYAAIQQMGLQPEDKVFALVKAARLIA